jgi:hypothetical protein
MTTDILSECRAIRCTTLVERHPFCPLHWALVPEDVKRKLHAHRPVVRSQPSRQYRATLRDAVLTVARLEAVVQAAQEQRASWWQRFKRFIRPR